MTPRTLKTLGLLLTVCVTPAQDPTPFLTLASIKGLRVQLIDDPLPLGVQHAGINVNLAARWSGPRSNCGRACGWIVGNEVNSDWRWSNLGPKPLAEVVAEYARAFRIVHAAVRTASAHAWLYASFEHHWASRAAGRSEWQAALGRDSLDAVAGLMADLNWHVARHPYPEDLLNPRTCSDKTVSDKTVSNKTVTDDDASPKLTFTNPKVTFTNPKLLCRHLERPELRFNGEPRRVILSPQGFHAPLEPDGELL